MGKTLEKVFLDKLKGMPVPEMEVQRPVKGKAKKGRAPPARSNAARATRKTVDSQSVHTVTSSNDAIEATEFVQEQSTNSSQPRNGQSSLPASAMTTAPVAQINNSHVQVMILKNFYFFSRFSLITRLQLLVQIFLVI